MTRKQHAVKDEARLGDAGVRLALDRFLLGIWTERDLSDYLRANPGVPAALARLESASSVDRLREAERLRRELLGGDRPNDIERLEALIREAVDRTERAMPVLAELQHDLLAHADAAGRDDPRASAVRILAELAAASQVNVAVQEVGRLAEATVDRVERARQGAIAKLREVLAGHPHLAPRAVGKAG